MTSTACVLPLLLLLAQPAASPKPGGQGTVEVASPDGRLVMTFAPSSSGPRAAPWRYRLERREASARRVLLDWSPLGLVRDDVKFEALLPAAAGKSSPLRERYSMPHGKRLERELVATARELVFSVPEGPRISLLVRVADDGAAFRYELPDEVKGRRIVAELTGFALPEGSRGWLLPADVPGRWSPAYENFFNEVSAGADAPTPQGWAFPALFRVGAPDAADWLLITESDVQPGNAGTRLDAAATQRTYRIRLPDAAEGLAQGAVEPVQDGVWRSPWRVVIAGSLPTIFSSTLAEDLAAPASGDYSWVKPGRSSIGWWSDDDASKKEEVLKAFVDLSASMGWEYSLVDANWHLAEPGVLERVVEHARAKGVGLFLWYNSGGPHNDVTEWGPRDRIHEAAARRAEFAKLKAMGIAGVKVDFWHSDKPPVIGLYHDMMRDAAAAGLLIAFHGSTTPRGWARTYPNLVTMEAVLGAEQYKYSERFARDAARHNTVLPFTRNVIGAMDYLPVALSDAKHPHLTTNAHELALGVVFESGLVHFPDTPKAYADLPPAAIGLLKTMPVAWDESRLLAGAPGEQVVVARRRGATWWVAAISGTREPSSAGLNLDFLGPGEWTLTMIRDAGAPRHVLAEEARVRSQDRFEVPMLGRGGFLMRLTPAPQ